MFLKILYIGESSRDSNSMRRAEAFRRLGHEVQVVDARKSVNWNWLYRAVHFRTGYVFLSRCVHAYVMNSVFGRGQKVDVIWVDGGDIIPASVVRELKNLFRAPAVLYSCDDPTGTRDGNRWLTLRKALKEYDVCTVVRTVNLNEFVDAGAKKVIRVYMSADEVAHAPRRISQETYHRWRSDVAFIGTWMPERGKFLLELTRLGVPLAIWGDRWQKAPEWGQLKRFWRGPALGGDDYAYAVQCAKFSLGLLSKGNRDLHTTRSSEIPFLGGVLCAERTVEHSSMYHENEEALFWSDAPECAGVVSRMMNNESAIAQIAKRGQNRVIRNKLLNQNVLSSVLEQVTKQ